MSTAVRSLSRALLGVSPHFNKTWIRCCSGKATRGTVSDIITKTDRLLDPENASAGGQNRVTMLSLQDDEDLLYITKYSPFGFTLNSGTTIYGPSVFFPNTCFSWRVINFEDIHEGSLSFFTMLEPRPDLLIIGTGRKKQQLSPGLVNFLRKNRLNFEVLTTDQAIATFNFQVNDQRWSVAALLPPEPIKTRDLSEEAKQRLNSRLDQTDIMLDVEIETEKLSSGRDKELDKKTLEQLMLPSSTGKIGLVKSPLGVGESYSRAGDMSPLKKVATESSEKDNRENSGKHDKNGNNDSGKS